ncbi:hypothetical protein V8E36_002513 [Tilletia maclaganii]
MSDPIIFWSSSPVVALLPSTSPSQAQHQPGSDADLEPQAATSPLSSNGDFPDDEAAEYDSDPANSASEADEESVGDEAELSEAESTDGEDDGASLRSFSGDFPSSSPQVPSSLESAKFSTTSSDASQGGDGHEEEHQAFHTPDGAWGPHADADNESPDEDEASSTATPSTQGDAEDNTGSETTATPSTPGGARDHGPQQDQKGKKRARSASPSPGRDKKASVSEGLDDLETNGFVICSFKPAPKAGPSQPSYETSNTGAKLEEPKALVVAEIMCNWIHDDRPALSQGLLAHDQMPTTLGRGRRNARLLRFESGEALIQVECESFLGMKPYWRWAHEVTLRRSVRAPTGCNGCASGTAMVRAP